MTDILESLHTVDWAQLDWQTELKNNITTVDELKTYLPLTADQESDLREVTDIHPMNIPRYYLSLIDPDNSEDPVRKLCVPDAQELVVAGAMGETTKDPYGDDKHDKGNGLLRIGVNPYYLYQCMPVARVRHHFQVPLKKGVDLVDDARRHFDGYAKRFKYILGHDIGKLEICGRIDDKLILKQIHARVGHENETSRLLVRQLTDKGGWLDDLTEVDL